MFYFSEELHVGEKAYWMIFSYFKTKHDKFVFFLCSHLWIFQIYSLLHKLIILLVVASDIKIILKSVKW